jgi:predicted AAA+ superfamily ATPase
VNELPYLRRWLEPTVEEALAEFPVVVVSGARQTGKTTMAQNFPGAAARPYLSLDDLRVLERAHREPDALVAEAPCMTLDEVQRVPDLLRAVKRAVDAGFGGGQSVIHSAAG